MVVLVDDRLLRSVLTDAEPEALRRIRGNDPVFTTDHFYLRLCRAIASSSVDGVLSRALGVLGDEERRRFVAHLTTLPAEVGMLQLRDVGWRMGELAATFRLNVLGLEVLAAAETLDATVCFATGNTGPALDAAIDRLGLRSHVV